MRLLQRDDAGVYSLTQDLPNGDIPPYAILSHTWGPDEVLFPDLQGPEDQWQQKDGYRKILFCAEQARRHGLRYVWVDTCCIDKSNSIELQTAINSMFRWYRDAAQCYVHMADVSKSNVSKAEGEEVEGNECWKASFRNSRWFTRGWTLQELIAPKVVELYSKEGIFLGDKQSLEYLLRDITRVPANALRGTPLSEFTVSERESWVRNRQTKYEEDMAYSLLGIFNVFLPLIYGEGRDEAQRRLREQVYQAANGAPKAEFSITLSLSEAPEVQKFVAREGELAEIRKRLLSDGSRRVVVLHGLGGIGKTQLAVAYIKRHRDEYSAVFWLNIKDEHTIRQSFVKAAKQIRQQYPNSPLFSEVGPGDSQSEAVEAVKSWLNLPGNTRWLIVYDNYDEAKSTDDESGVGVDIAKFLPAAHHGAIIITTRLSLIDVGHVIRVRKLESTADSLDILTSTSGRGNLSEDPDAQKLVEKLDGLPLALATAGAYLRRVSMKPADYLRHYDRSWTRLHESTPNIGSYKDRTLCSTWQISYQQVEEQTPLAAQLLRWWAYFDSQDLWLELIQAKPEDAPRWLEQLGDELAFHEAMGTLHDYGFVEPCIQNVNASGSQGYSIHSCLHSWTKHVLNQEPSSALGCLAVQCVASCVPTGGSAPCLRLCRRLLSHAKVSFAGARDLIGEIDDLEWVPRKLSFLYGTQDMFKDAEHVLSCAVRAYERKHGPDHEKSLDYLAMLGEAYRDQNRMSEAEEAFFRAIRGQERVLGAEHPLLVFSLGCLASMYVAQSRFAEAEAVYQRILDMQDRLWGPDDEQRLQTLVRMAQLYTDQCKVEEAEQLLVHVLERFESIEGRGCQSALRTRTSLGDLYLEQRKLPKAEKMFAQALEGLKKLHGLEHLDTLFAMTRVAYVCRLQGKLREAEAMCEEVVRGYEATLGRENRTTALALIELAEVYSLQNRPADAEAIYHAMLADTERAVGPAHVNTLSAVRDLGNLHYWNDRLSEAEAAYRRALAGWDPAYGSGHRDQVSLLSSLGQVCMRQGRLEEAETLLVGALRGYEEALAPADFARYRPALDAVTDMGSLRLRQGKYNEAQAHYSRAYESYCAFLGPDSVAARNLREDLRMMDRLMYETDSGCSDGDDLDEGTTSAGEDEEVNRGERDSGGVRLVGEKLEERVEALALRPGDTFTA